jgi:hypothetical protein
MVTHRIETGVGLLALSCRSAVSRGPHRMSEVGAPTDGLFAASCDVTTARPVTYRAHQSRSTTQWTYRATTTQVTSWAPPPPLQTPPSRYLFIRPKWDASNQASELQLPPCFHGPAIFRSTIWQLIFEHVHCQTISRKHIFHYILVSHLRLSYN